MREEVARFASDDKVLVEEDLSRHHVLTGFEIVYLRDKAYRMGFGLGILSVFVGIFLVWLVIFFLGLKP